MVTRVESNERVLYARWEIRVFRGVERFSDYKRVKARTPRVHGADVSVLRGQKRRRRSLLSIRGLTIIIAVGTVVLVLLTIATLIVLLLLDTYIAAAPTKWWMQEPLQCLRPGYTRAPLSGSSSQAWCRRWLNTGSGANNVEVTFRF
jgi:hypothetical protein